VRATLIRPVTKPTKAYQGMLPKRVSIIDKVSASSACRLSRVAARVAPSRRNDALRKFKNFSLLFCDADRPDPSYNRIQGELFCIT
jgi:hypothetical protein